MRTLKINGSIFNGLLLDNWNISQKINQISTFKCGILNVSKEQEIIDISNIVEGSNLELFNGENKIFSGIIKTIAKSEYNVGILKLDLTVSDNNEIANRRIVVASFVNKNAGWLVKNVILPVLAEEGVSEGNIEDSFELLKVNFNYITCTQALNYLQTCTGLNWNIDKDKKLNFVSNTSIKAPFDVDSNLKYKNFKATRKYEQYRNTQYLLGGQGITSPQINEELTPAPDGEIIEFYTRFSISEKPKLEKYSNGIWNEINPNDIGIQGIDSNKKFYFAYNSKIITQSTEEVPLAQGEKLRATYVGLKNIFVIYTDDAQILKRASIENSSGKYENFEKDSSILTTEEASQFASSLIKKFGEIEDKVTFSTEQEGLEAGQLIKIENKELNIIEQSFLIESVKIKPIGFDALQYDISALDGISLGGWETYFKAIVEASQDVINPDENVIFIKNIADESNVAEKLNIQIDSERFVYMGDNLIMQDNAYMGVYQRTEVDVI